jgi:serine protease
MTDTRSTPLRSRGRVPNLHAVAWLIVALALPVAAQRTAQPEVFNDEVIVRFKAGADTTRAVALSSNLREGNALALAAAVRAQLQRRADALGARRGMALAAGIAIDERTQVMRAGGVSAQALVARLRADAEVESVEPNWRVRRMTPPNDPLYPATAPGVRPSGPDSGQWYLRPNVAPVTSSIDVEPAWARSTGTGVVVAVLDTGVRFDHPDLGRAAASGQLLPGYDFVSDTTIANDGDGQDADPSDPGDWVTSAESAGSGTLRGCEVGGSSWHGTSTSSLVVARTNEGTGMAGVAPGAKVLPLRVLGKCGGSSADIRAAMRWAAGLEVPGVPTNTHPAKVLNMSLGVSGAACSAQYQQAVDDVRARGTAIVVAAGNGAGGPVGSPANCTGVIAVVGLRHVGSKVGFSDLGPEASIAAPGGNCINIRAGSPCLYPILSATNSGTTTPLGNGWTDSFDISVGTSFATPLVAGTAALMIAARPSLTPDDVRRLMRNTARPFPTSGADNGPDDPTPVGMCVAPQGSVQQLQCYCTTALCGAGMLDAGAAVAAASGSALAVIGVAPATPQAGTTINLSSTGSGGRDGRPITGYAWALVSGGGVATGFSSATNAATATIQPTAAGAITVRLTITDDAGNSASTERAINVDAATPANPPATGGGGGGGGGAVDPAWAALLALAVLALRHVRGRPWVRAGRDRIR